MSTPKYTPGPWAVSWTEDEGHRIEPDIAMLWRHHEADARLLAAAPELLAALKRIMAHYRFIESGPDFPDAWAAIRKAEGK